MIYSICWFCDVNIPSVDSSTITWLHWTGAEKMRQGNITQCAAVDTGVGNRKSKTWSTESEHLLFLDVIYLAFHWYIFLAIVVLTKFLSFWWFLQVNCSLGHILCGSWDQLRLSPSPYVGPLKSFTVILHDLKCDTSRFWTLYLVICLRPSQHFI